MKSMSDKWCRIESDAPDRAVVAIDGIIGGSWYGMSETDGCVPAKELVEQLNTLSAEVVEIHVNSPGGMVFDGLKIFNALRALSAKKETICIVDGVAASIASILPLACRKSIMPAASFLMIHNPWSYAEGNAAAFRAQAAELDKIKESLIEIYANGRPEMEHRFAALMDGADGADGTWLSADEALELGLVDEVETSIKAAACAGVDRWANLPEAVAKLHAAAGKRDLESDLRTLGYTQNEAKAIVSGKAELVKHRDGAGNVDWTGVLRELKKQK